MLGFNIRRGSKELILLRIYGLLWLALVLGWWYRHVLEAVGFCLAVNGGFFWPGMQLQRATNGAE